MERPRTREEAEKLIGKRTPRLGEGKPPGPNWTPKPEEAERKPPEPERRGRRMGNLSDPLGLKKSLRDREAAAGLKSGGMVRGCGTAKKGGGKGTVY